MAYKRLFAFDILRVIAILSILFCHSCFIWSGCDWIGRYFAQTFNLVFLLISAFLIGMKWENDGSPRLGTSFIARRVRRIAETFYPFLIIALLMLYLKGDYPSPSVVVSQFLFLSWFKPLPYFGQLWYLTMIVICYVLCFVISNNAMLKSVLRGERGLAALLSVVLLAVACMSASTLSGYPGAIFLYAILYSIVFSNAKRIVSLIPQFKACYWIMFALVVNVPALYLYYKGLFSMRLASYFVSTLTSVSIFGLILSMFRAARSVRFIGWMAGISFEMYLVHEFFLGPVNVYSYCNHFFGYVALVALSVIAAVALKNICLAVNRFIGKI